MFLRNLGPSAKHKLADRWRNELFEVVEKLPRIPVYRIRGPEGRIKAWHRNHLLPVPQVATVDEEPQSDIATDSNDVPCGNSGDQSDDSDWFTPPPESPVQVPSPSTDGGLPQRGGLNPATPAFEPTAQNVMPTVPGMVGAPSFPTNAVPEFSRFMPEGLRRGDRVRRPPPVFTYDTLGRPCYAVQNYVQPHVLTDMIAAHSRLVSMMPICY